MVNFKPMQDHLLECAWKLIEKYGAKDPFLDIGGGRGEESLFLVRKGWQGTWEDISKAAYDTARRRLADTPVQLVFGGLNKVKGHFGTVLLMDVIEHVKDDTVLLKRARDFLLPEGHLVVSVPMHQREWRNDDHNYGHFRRYESDQLKNLLERAGFRVLELWDHSFPFFWLFRRLYAPFIKKSRKAMDELTGVSYQNPLFAFFNKWFSHSWLWRPLNSFQDLFKHNYWGCHVVVIARKR